MNRNNIEFSQLPVQVKIALLMQVAAWMFFVFANSALNGTISLIHLTMGLLCCVICFSFKKWARVFCIAYDTLMIGLNLYTIYSEYGRDEDRLSQMLICLVTAILFSLSIYMLCRKDVSCIYRNESNFNNA